MAISDIPDLAEIIARQVETQPWVWRMKVLRQAGGWHCLFHHIERNREDPQNALPRVNLSIFQDPVTGEQVDELEACRRQLMRNLGVQ